MMRRSLIKGGEIEVSNLVLVRLVEVCLNSGRVISLRWLVVRAQEGGEGEDTLPTAEGNGRDGEWRRGGAVAMA